MLPPGALENADNPDLATGQKIITTSCSFILNKLNFVGRGVQRTQNFQDLAHGLKDCVEHFYIILCLNNVTKIS